MQRGMTVSSSDAPAQADAPDFPYYDGEPATISGRRWLVVLVAILVAYGTLGPLNRLFDGPVTALLPAVVFTGVQLLALLWATPGHWRAVFRKVTARGLWLMAGFAALAFLFALGLASFVGGLVGLAPNRESEIILTASVPELVTFYPRLAIQLLGEELLTILPFLALLTFFTGRATLTRQQAITRALLITAVFFGLLHLPSYDWNLAQSVIVIGGARAVLTLAYVVTKNIWVSTGAHILYDWSLFTITLLWAGA